MMMDQFYIYESSNGHIAAYKKIGCEKSNQCVPLKVVRDIVAYWLTSRRCGTEADVENKN